MPEWESISTADSLNEDKKKVVSALSVINAIFNIDEVKVYRISWKLLDNTRPTARSTQILVKLLIKCHIPFWEWNKKICIKGILLKLIVNYLKDRKLTVKIRSALIYNFTVTGGIPQESPWPNLIQYFLIMTLLLYFAYCWWPENL